MRLSSRLALLTAAYLLLSISLDELSSALKDAQDVLRQGLPMTQNEVGAGRFIAVATCRSTSLTTLLLSNSAGAGGRTAPTSQRATVGRCEETLYAVIRAQLIKYAQTFPYAKPQGAIEAAIGILSDIYGDPIFVERNPAAGKETFLSSLKTTLTVCPRCRASHPAQAGRCTH